MSLTGLVPVALSILNTTPHKYDLIMSQVTWSNAQNYCRVIYNDLATIQSDTDWVRLNKAGSKSPSSSAWVGLYNDIDSWRWSLDDLPLKNVTYKYWIGGRPNNVGGKASCVMMGTYANWYDADCTIKRPFVCYNGELISWVWLRFAEFWFEHDLASRIILLLKCKQINFTHSSA